MKIITSIILILGLLLSQRLAWANQPYGAELCNRSDYYCHKVERGDSWEKLWPDDEQRDIVKRINRMNIRLRPDMTIAVPKNLSALTIYDVAPFPRYIDPAGEKLILISQQHLAWAAYSPEGELIWWGPISSGKDLCGDVKGTCRTPGGSYRIIRKQGSTCRSTQFPARRGRAGGAPMPYCMHYFRGYALHGFPIVPGERASHGCIRLFVEDARWLNEHFINTPKRGKGGTRVILEGL